MTEERVVRLNGVGRLAGGRYDDVHIEGVGRIEGDVECATLSVSGKCQVRGRIRAARVTIEGKCDVRGDIEAESIQVSGWLTVRGNLAADRLVGHGLLRVEGLVNADEVDLRGPGRIREVGGGRVSIDCHRPVWLRWLNGFRADTVEGDDVRLVGVHARWVRGDTIDIGSGCRVDRVEYRRHLRQAPDAVVRDARQA
ncbi:MAG: polymer-forming cytoskeletal protein [Alicyclobacillaceae bacterium]|nr:polymer-forming cytoskeletal protein [Alicyclobacillaceae bacterium]